MGASTNTMNIIMKLQSLTALRHDLGEELFRRSVAGLYTKHIVSKVREREMDIDRSDLLSWINLMMVSFQCEEVSYGFLRQYI